MNFAGSGRSKAETRPPARRSLLVRLPGLALLLVGLAASSPPTERAASRLVIGVRGDVSSFNLYTATNAFSQDVIDLLDLKLADEQDDFSHGPPTFRPSLASSWEFSGDRLHLTFHLDPRARWSDGKPVTAEDVLFTHKVASSADVGWVGSDVKEQIAEVTAPDSRSVVVRFKSLYPYALMDAAEGNVLPARAYEKIPLAEWPKQAFLDVPASCGPFLLKRYERGAVIELVRNPGYFRSPLPRLDSVVFRILPDEATLVNELLSGGIDFMENIPADAVARIQANPRLRIVRVPDLSYTFISWNLSRPWFSDPRVRRALTLAIDRQAIIDGLLPGVGRPSAGPILSFMWARDPSLKPPPFDPAEARRILKEAGWEDRDRDGVLEKDGKPFHFELESNQGSSLRAAIVEMVSEQLRRVGVEAVPRIFEFSAFVARHEKHDYDAFVSSWRESTKVDLKSAFATSSQSGGYNYGLYSNPGLDGIIDRARVENDPGAARKLWAQAQQIIARDLPYTFLFERDRLNAVPKSLRGLHPSPRSAYAGLEEWSLESSVKGKP